MTKARNVLIATLAGVTMLAAALVAGDTSAAAAGAGSGDRVARASANGGWVSAHIYWRPHGRETGPLGGPLYDATVRGAVRDTKGDHQGVELQVNYYDSALGVDTTVTLATARGKGRLARGRRFVEQVRDVKIRVCTDSSFSRERCSGWA